MPGTRINVMLALCVASEKMVPKSPRCWGIFLVMSIVELEKGVSTHSFGIALSWGQLHHVSSVWGLGGLTQTGPLIIISNEVKRTDGFCL
jgi:hypothetical protein